jgi:hypothetical protein
MSVHCACGLSLDRQLATVIQCSCGLTHLPMWYEFAQPKELKDEEDDRQAFLCLPFSLPTIFPCLPCQLPLDGDEDKEVVAEGEGGIETHPFWLAIQNAIRDETVGDWRWNLQEGQGVGEMAVPPYNFAQRLYKLRLDCSCLNCSCINYPEEPEI